MSKVKKIGDLTLNEFAKICDENRDCFGYCNKDCPLKYICGTTKHIGIITYDKGILGQEIEVEEKEKKEGK